MPYIDIDIDDFLSDCNRVDINYIIKALDEDGHLESNGFVKQPIKTQLDSEWDTTLNRLSEPWRLSVEEQNIIKSIADKYAYLD